MDESETKKDYGGKVVSRGAALWAFAFAFLHIAWAAGWYIGLPAEEARAAFQKTWFFVYDLIAAVLCLIAATLALRLADQKRRRVFPFRLIVFIGWNAAAILALRGVAGVVKIAYSIIIGNFVADSQIFWDLWFCLGAVLFGLSVWNYQRISNNAR